MERGLTLVLIGFLLFSCSQTGSPTGGERSLLKRDDTIKTGYISLENSDPNTVRQQMYDELKTFSASIVSEYWSDPQKVQYTGSMTVSVPSDRFLGLVEWIKNRFHVTSISLSARETDNPKNSSNLAEIKDQCRRYT